MSMRQFHQDVANDIRHDGRSVVCVGSDDSSPSFAYTIGNWPRFPELLIIGTLKGDILNTLSDMMIKRGVAFADGELVNAGGKLPAKIIVADVRARDQYTIQAGQHFGHEDYCVLQVLVSDRDGHFPDEPGCQPPYCDIPVLRGQ
jgi:hypothetical protein